MLFDKAYAPKRDEYVTLDAHDDMFTDYTATSQASPVPAELHHLVQQPKAIFHARHIFNRVVYTRVSTHVGNSLVYFYAGGDRRLSPIPGCIKYILDINNKVCFAVQRQLAAQHSSTDPFRHYPHFGAMMYSPDLAPELEIIQVDWVVCHFARWPLSSDHVIVLSLCLVSNFFPLSALADN